MAARSPVPARSVGALPALGGRRNAPPPGAPGRRREQELCQGGKGIVAGIDEVGRGALAGPVVAAAVVLPHEWCGGILDDSKRLSPALREQLYHQILEQALAASVFYVSPRQIDEINILQASREALRGAVRALSLTPDVALVDGLPVPDFPCAAEALVGGDGLECCIAAASIVAKVSRDRLMCVYGSVFPAYRFESHKGYSTRTHRRALRQHGFSPIHRRSFAPHLTLPGIEEEE